MRSPSRFQRYLTSTLTSALSDILPHQIKDYGEGFQQPDEGYAEFPSWYFDP
jgi:hypothetical protein